MWPSSVSQHNSCPAEALGGSREGWWWCNALSPDTCCIHSKLDPNAWMLGRVKWFLLHLTLLLWLYCEPSSLHGAVAKLCRDLLAQASIFTSVCKCFPVCHQPLNYDSASQVVPYGSLMNVWSLRSAPARLWVLWIIWELVTENWFLYLGLMDQQMAWDTLTSGRLHRDNVACKIKILLVEQRLKKV